MRLVPVKNYDKPDDVGYVGRDCEYEVTNEEQLRMEIFPGGPMILDVAPPPGKRWRVYLNISIKEFDTSTLTGEEK